MNVARIALLVQLGSTLPLVGLIWLVQIVAYPLFAEVGAAEFLLYHAAHARLITFVVGPLMVAELASAVLLVFVEHPALPRPLALLGAALAAATWAITMFVSVPRHELLAHGFSAHVHAMLVATNWLRTAAWTFRGGLLLAVVDRALRP